MEPSSTPPAKSTQPSEVVDRPRGHLPLLFKGQKAAILDLLLNHRGDWVPVFRLAALALQYIARIKELRDAGYVIDNRTSRHGQQVHGSFRLVSCPDETGDMSGGR